ncbi:MAG: zinc ribbon domain-containing protein [Acidobacteriaceae bacterium]
MHDELAKLVHLQELEQQAQALTLQIAQYTGRVEVRDAALYDTGRLLEQNATALAKELSLRRRLELDAEDLRQKSARYRVQLDDAKSDGQVKALEHQLKFCKKEIDRIEELEFASLTETEALEVKQRLLHETRANQLQALENEKAASQLGRDRDKPKLAELYRERDAVRQSADPELLANYDRMASAHKLPIATVEQQRCSACQMMVRPQRWNEIRQGAVHFCESCGRFLYYNPAVDVSDAMHLPSTGKKPAALVNDPAHPKPTGSDRPTRED